MRPPVSPSKTTCGSLLQELQLIWDEIGESDSDRDKMLFELEQECLDIYRRKVERTRKYRADLHQTLAEAEVEIAKLNCALGEHVSFSRAKGTLKQQIAAINPTLEELNSKKEKRIKDFYETQSQIVRISAEIAGYVHSTKSADPLVNDSDLTLKKLGSLKSHLHDLQNEKSLRLQKVNSCISSIHELSVVMSFDFFRALNEVHPSLSDSTPDQTKSISNDTIARLTDLLHTLKQEKQQRLQKLQGLGSKLLELWNLMDTSLDERKRYDYIISLISSTVEEVSGSGFLGLDVIEQAEMEVERLDALKASKMTELVLKRQNELEEIYREVHMDVDSDAAQQILINLIESGNADLSDLLSSMDDQIAKAKEEAISRKEILDKYEKWKYALEEEKWLDEYEKDENRYSAGRGAHKNLKRAEKARILVSKIPTITENLIVKIKAWETDRGVLFLYDKSSLLHPLEEYTALRVQKEEEKRISREQKRLQGQLAAEKEALYGSRPPIKKPLGQSLNSDNVARTPLGRRVGTPSGRLGLSSGKERRDSGRGNSVIPLNYVALHKDDTVSK